MNELLFECYSIPKLCLGVDALFSLHHNSNNHGNNNNSNNNTFIVSLGFQTVHFIPVLNGKVDFPCVRRLNIGGFNMINYLQRGLQLKYPGHLNSITVSIQL